MSGQIGVNLSICLTDIPKELIKTAKNGKAYANLSAFITSEVNSYTTKDGKVITDNGGITLPQTKEQREAKEKKVYVGNVKVYWSNREVILANTGEPSQDAVNEPEDTGLPF